MKIQAISAPAGSTYVGADGVQVLPEPSTYAVWSVLAAAGLLLYRRRQSLRVA